MQVTTIKKEPRDVIHVKKPQLHSSLVLRHTARERAVVLLGVVHHQPGQALPPPPARLQRHQLPGRQTAHRPQGGGRV